MLQSYVRRFYRGEESHPDDGGREYYAPRAVFSTLVKLGVPARRDKHFAHRLRYEGLRGPLSASVVFNVVDTRFIQAREMAREPALARMRLRDYLASFGFRPRR